MRRFLLVFTFLVQFLDPTHAIAGGLMPCAGLLAKFGPESAIVFEPGITLTDEEIQRTIAFLSSKPEYSSSHQVDFQILNTEPETWRSVPVLGSLNSIPHATEIGGQLKRGFVLDPSVDPATLPFLTLPPGSNYHHPYSAASRRLPTAMVRGVAWFLEQVAKAYLSVKGPAYRLQQGTLMLRVSSNTLGHAVTRAQYGDPKTGMHIHDLRAPNVLEFTWAIHGKGTRFGWKNGVHQLEPGQALIFGGKVPHGSPDSDETRLLAVGTIVLEKRKSR